MGDIEITRYGAEQAEQLAGELIGVYAKVYNIPPYIGDPFFSVASFADRLTAAFPSEGFEAVVGRLDGQIVGYVHGATLPSDKLWFTALGEARPDQMVAAAEKGEVFWMRELMVLPEVQNHGIGHTLHDATIDDRSEPWTTLTCIVDNEPAHGAYLRWGYQIIGQIKHAPESPIYDAMVLPPRL